MEGIRESMRIAGLSALLLSHGEASAFGIEPGSGFGAGIEKVKQGTLHDKFESIGLLAVESGDGASKYSWSGSRKLEWASGGFNVSPGGVSSLLKGVIGEIGAPFTVYNLHSHNIDLPMSGIDPSRKAYSVPPSASDVLGALERAPGQKYQYGSRTFTMRYAASDGAGVWFFDRIPTDTLKRGPLVVAHELEGVGKSEVSKPLRKWIDANALEGEKDAATVEEHVRSLMSGELYRSLVEAYRKVGVNVRYTLWSDLDENDFPASRNTKQ